MRYDTIFFDFDGTLNESGPGIFAATRAMMRELDIPDIPDSEMRKLVGPPLRVGFSTILGIDGELLDEAVSIYRLKAKTCGIDKMKAYDGILDLLGDLRTAGSTVGIVTAKVHSTALEHIELFGFAPYIDYIRGARSDGSGDKSELLRIACDELGVDKRRTAMVGDRYYDLCAANKSGVDGIGVLYGYGSAAELAECDPAYIAATVADLRNILFS
ncbi:MAG: HAD hydrolase-like protein [Clostridia bacterium]